MLERNKKLQFFTSSKYIMRNISVNEAFKIKANAKAFNY